VLQVAIDHVPPKGDGQVNSTEVHIAAVNEVEAKIAVVKIGMAGLKSEVIIVQPDNPRKVRTERL
jgi:hypothetical protein